MWFCESGGDGDKSFVLQHVSHSRKGQDTLLNASVFKQEIDRGLNDFNEWLFKCRTLQATNETFLYVLLIKVPAMMSQDHQSIKPLNNYLH